MTRSIADLDWPVRTERLSLRPAEQRDALPTFAFRSLPEVAHWMTNHATGPDGLGGGLRGAAARHAGRREGRRRHRRPLRCTSRTRGPRRRSASRPPGTLVEIGYVLDPAYAGQGYATEAVREELRICFEDLGVRRVIAQCFADNVPSWRLMERVGMRREQHTKKDSLHRNGEWLDGMMYALLADEWRRDTRDPRRPAR